MKMHRISAFAWFLLAVSSASTAADATIKKKDGSVVTGTLGGVIVLKTDEKAGEEFTASYLMINGDSVAGIDESGLRRGPVFVILNASQKGTPLDDNEVVVAATERIKSGGGGPLMAADLPRGGHVFIIGGRSAGAQVSRGRLLGQFRESGGKSRLFPSLEVTTSGGKVVVPVSEIVEFSK